MKSFRIAVYEESSEEALRMLNYLKDILPNANIEIYQEKNKLEEEFQKMETPFELIFLTISPANPDAIEMANKIHNRNLFVPIIFISESDQFYKEAFAAFAFNYLLKPLDRKQLEYVLYPLIRLISEREEKSLTFRYRSQVYTLKLNQIMYISSSLHTVNFYLKDGNCVHCRGKLNEFDEQLKETAFLRCHQSFYVNMEEITSMKANNFKIGENIVPISRSYAKQTQQKYKEFLIKKGKNNKI